jgi:hypothetical protein
MKICIILLVGAALVLGACSSGSSGGDGGDTGQPTAKWFVEKGPPSNSQGANGDLYLDQDAAILYVKVNGQWQAAASLRGTSGSGWLFGSGAPASTLGSDGDLYLDTSTTLAYRKLNGSWGVLFALKGDTGATGATGTQWYSGANAPTSNVPSTARAGDYYLQTSTAMIYKKDSNGSWSSVLVLSYNTASFIYTPHMSVNTNYNGVYYNAVAYGNGVYIAVGTNGTIIKSTDGTNWKIVESTANTAKIPKGLEQDPNPNTNINDNLYDVAYGNNTFVAISESRVYISSDGGDTWEENTPGIEESFSYVVFLNGKFFLSTYSGEIYTSTDGSSWNSNDSGGEYLSEVAYGNGKYIAFSFPEGLGGVCTSLDGINWVLTSVEGINSTAQIYSLVFGSGLFVAVGTDGSTGIAMIWISTDGINWSSQDLPVSGSTEFFDIAYGNGFAVVGFDGFSGYKNIIATSANGISWNIQTLPYSSDLSGIAPASPAGTFVIAKGQQRGW